MPEPSILVSEEISVFSVESTKFLVPLDKIPSPVLTTINTPSNSEEYPTLNIYTGKINAFDLCNNLKVKSGLFLNEKGLSENFMTVHPMNLSEDNIQHISDVLHNDIKEYIK